MNSLFDYFDRLTPLSPETKRMIEKTVEEIQLPKGTLLVKQDEPCAYLYIIAAGLARGFRLVNGEEVTVSFKSSNEVLRDTCNYISGSKALKSYELLEDSRLFRINIARFRTLFTLDHEICNLGRLMAEDFVMQMDASQRSYMGLTAQKRYEVFLKEKSGLIYRVKSKHIASYLHLTPETFYRIHAQSLKKRVPKLAYAIDWPD